MGGKLNKVVTGFASSKDGIAWTAQPPAKSIFAPNHSFTGGSYEQCGCAWGGAANPRYYCAVLGLEENFALEAAIGSHACWLEANISSQHACDQ
jgi:hypothetical protein